MAERSRARLSAEEQEELMQLVGFRIKDEYFGVNILSVQEIIRSARITPVPNSPDFVEGVINLRGDIIPVVDLRKRLSLFDEGAEQRSWILILDIDNKIIGFIVDEVTEVLKIDEESIEPAPDIVVSGLQSQYIYGVVDIEDRLVIILDFDRVLMGEEVKRLNGVQADEIDLDEASIIE